MEGVVPYSNALDTGGDVISGNIWEGVHIVGSSDNVVDGDYIGLTASGSASLGNDESGVGIYAGSSNNTIGGTTTGEGDVISGNNWEGVHIVGTGTTDNETSGNVVEGDYIGTNVGGSADLANAESGVGIYSGAANNTIGGYMSGSGNVISGNDSNGVYIVDQGTSSNVVAGNDIGLNASQSQKLANNANGVYIGAGATGNTIGGSSKVSGGSLAVPAT